MEALKLFGKNWKKVQEYVGTRTTTQARSHAQKYFAKIDHGNFGEDFVDDGVVEENSPENNEEIPMDNDLCELARSKSTTNSESTPPVSESPTKTKGKKVKGPYSPGKRPLKCEFIDAKYKGPYSPGKRQQKLEYENESKPCVSQTAINITSFIKKQPIIEPIIPAYQPPAFVPEIHEYPVEDYSYGTKAMQNVNEPNMWGEKSNGGMQDELDFDMAPVENIPPLVLDEPFPNLSLGLMNESRPENEKNNGMGEFSGNCMEETKHCSN